MTIEKALPYLKEHQQELINRILRGKYTPSPVRRVEIPKPDGGVRKLGIQEKRLIEKGRYIRMGYEYDSKGRVTTFHNPNGNDVKYCYENIGEPVLESYPEGETFVYKYDEAGRLMSESKSECEWLCTYFHSV